LYTTSAKRKKAHVSGRLFGLSTRFAPVTRQIALDGAFLSVLIVSAFSVLALTAVDVFTGSGVAHSLYLLYYATIDRIIPPIGSAFGLNVGLYLTLALVSFAFLNRKSSLVPDMIQTLKIGTLLVVAFETALYFMDPEWRNVFVVTAQAGTSLQWFTNDDLLICALVVLIALQAASMRFKRRA
jgi:hypothetical protein